MTKGTIDSKHYQYATFNFQKDEKSGTYLVKYRLKSIDGSLSKNSMKRGFKTLKEAKVFAENLKREHAEALYK